MKNQNRFSTPEQARIGKSSGVSLGIQWRTNKQLALTEESLSFSQILFFLLLHVPIMFIFRAAPVIATIHSLIVLLIGLVFLSRDERPTRVAWVLAYLAGAEILWRGVGASLVSEYCKYATILLCVLVILKFRLMGRTTLWPLLFVALLIPGIIIAPKFDRQAISFQLAGLVALGMASLVFSTLEFKKNDLQRLFLAIIAPTVSIAVYVAFLTDTTNTIFSGGGANEQVTGGIGANQVASALSLGAMAAFFYIFLTGKDRRTHNLMIVLLIGLITASIVTFSRGGLWNFVGALGVGALFLMRSRQQLLKLLGSFLIIGLLGYFVVFPMLNSLTGGALLARYSDFDSTGRDVLFKIDYDLFLKNPVWGVGVGGSPVYHLATFGYLKPTHVEYGRLLAEHGSLGLAALALLAGVTLHRLFSHRQPISKAISTSFTVWALLYLAHSATRMVAPSFAFGLAAARFLPEEEKDENT